MQKQTPIEKSLLYLDEFFRLIPKSVAHIPLERKYARVVLIIIWRAERFKESILSLNNNVSQLVAFGLIRPLMEMVIDTLYIASEKDNTLAERYAAFEAYENLKQHIMGLTQLSEDKHTFKDILAFYSKHRNEINIFIDNKHQQNDLKNLLSNKPADNILNNIYSLFKVFDWRPKGLKLEVMYKKVSNQLSQMDMDHFEGMYRMYYKYPSSSLHSSPVNAYYYINEPKYDPQKDMVKEDLAFSALPGIYRCFQIAALNSNLITAQENLQLDQLFSDIPDF